MSLEVNVTRSTPELVRPTAKENWTDLELLPFEPIAERLIDLQHEEQSATVTVTIAKPFYVEGKGWACPYRIAALGREHITPAGGADSVQALQMAMHMIHNELSGMARHHRMSFLGTQDFGFGRVGGAAPAAGSRAEVRSAPSPEDAAAQCPVMNMSLNG